jgi:hypothetical protein
MTHHYRGPAVSRALRVSLLLSRRGTKASKTDLLKGADSTFTGFYSPISYSTLIRVTELFVQPMIVSHLPAALRCDVIQNCITLYLSNVFEKLKGE